MERELMMDKVEEEEGLVEGALFEKEVLLTQAPFIYCPNLQNVGLSAVFTFTFSINPT